MTKEPTQDSFETRLSRLENIVETMEQGKLSLDEALKHFEEGVKLTQNCQQMLDNARQRVKVLSNDQQLDDFASPTEE
ncbi:exodeoxyribonuclease VII small subunit [Pleionea sp. CnH1-48]|uniref:exodeoxyribonuclease VII small subunit n=1 Tax=Pleionea sp. CnH1-48 TaxID=2954494 RepID=UPI0020972689|nr:exodeoxyribonuclease VII small subunit [Pleionea sp. CnH1-48]MCO7226685.1 exodeoxyribonuclease VII small subunit [Pleionea sp. CnH1-48]